LYTTARLWLCKKTFHPCGIRTRVFICISFFNILSKVTSHNTGLTLEAVSVRNPKNFIGFFFLLLDTSCFKEPFYLSFWVMPAYVRAAKQIVFSQFPMYLHHHITLRSLWGKKASCAFFAFLKLQCSALVWTKFLDVQTTTKQRFNYPRKYWHCFCNLAGFFYIFSLLPIHSSQRPELRMTVTDNNRRLITSVTSTLERSSQEPIL
jgi:hypothetical protein